VGETADRIGFRCLNPRTLKYSSEIELVFDEQSALKRVDQLRQLDIRRKLVKRGKLQQYPLVANDFAVDSRHYERNAFSSPDVPSPALQFRESEGAFGSQKRADQPSVDEEDYLIGDHRGDGSALREWPGRK
jgi:hypothetical protein